MSLDEQSRQIISAQNRTTHAIRALVRFIFIQLTAITMAIILFVIGSEMEDSLVQIVAIMIYIIGVVWSSNAGRDELKKSEIPKS